MRRLCFVVRALGFTVGRRAIGFPLDAISRWTWGRSLEIEIMAKEDDLIDDPPSTRVREGTGRWRRE
jgi:hypothetical protein